MPNFDRTGPVGAGPMTGRGAGVCETRGVSGWFDDIGEFLGGGADQLTGALKSDVEKARAQADTDIVAARAILGELRPLAASDFAYTLTSLSTAVEGNYTTVYNLEHNLENSPDPAGDVAKIKTAAANLHTATEQLKQYRSAAQSSPKVETTSTGNLQITGGTTPAGVPPASGKVTAKSEKKESNWLLWGGIALAAALLTGMV